MTHSLAITCIGRGSLNKQAGYRANILTTVPIYHWQTQILLIKIGNLVGKQTFGCGVYLDAGQLLTFITQSCFNVK